MSDPSERAHRLVAALEQASAKVRSAPAAFVDHDGRLTARLGEVLLSLLDPGDDLLALAYLVLMAAAKSAEDDLKAIAIRRDLDSMSELGETESLRLQMAMDRMAKMMSTLSNLLKKISDTASGIVQNLK